MGFLKKRKTYGKALNQAIRDKENIDTLEITADCAINLIDSIGLIDEKGNEIGVRKPATFVKTGEPGVISPSQDIMFDVPAGVTVCGWRAYSGDVWIDGTLTPETYTEDEGEYLLQCAKTKITHYF